MNGIERFAIKKVAEHLRDASKQAENAAKRWGADIDAPGAEGCERDEMQNAMERSTGLLAAANRVDELLAALDDA